MRRHAWYQSLYEQAPAILADAGRVRDSLELPPDCKPALYSGMSSCPANLPDFVLEAIRSANTRGAVSVRSVEDEIREAVMDLFGDDCDCAVTNTCEAGLRVAIEVLMAPPILHRGETYRARMLTSLGEDYDWAACYGRPFPPRYKHLAADRSVSAGELGMDAKCLANVDTVFVRCAGVSYEVHGIRQAVVPNLLSMDVDATLARIDLAADRHARELSGILATGYDTPGYGQAERGSGSAPGFLEGLGRTARRMDVPMLVDCASCIPGFGFAPRDAGADVMAWSMDKVARAPTCGLLVGTQEAMLPIRRALGIGGARHGHVSSHGKAAFSLADPGRDALVGLLAVLRRIRTDRDYWLRPLHALHRIVLEELRGLADPLRDALVVTISEHMGGIEINYARTWLDDQFGIPMFTLEDAYLDLNLICRAMEVMGVGPPSIYSGNVLMSVGPGLLQPDGNLREDVARAAVRGLVKSLQIVCRHAGVDA